MSFRLHGYRALALVFILALSSAAMFAVQGKMRDASGQMVLCTGQGPITVSMETGQPAPDAGNHCPDSIPVPLAWVAETPAVPPVQLLSRRLVFEFASPVWNGRFQHGSLARGPPGATA